LTIINVGFIITNIISIVIIIVVVIVIVNNCYY